MSEPIIHSYETETSEKESFFSNHSKKMNYILPIGIVVFIIGIVFLVVTQRNLNNDQNNQASTGDNPFNILGGTNNNQNNVKGDKTSSHSGQITKSPSPNPIKPTPTPKSTPTPTPKAIATPQESPTPVLPTESPVPSESPTPSPSDNPSPTSTL